jgi:hypothetical protein
MPAAPPNLLIQPVGVSRLYKVPAFSKFFSCKVEIIGQFNPPT